GLPGRGAADSVTFYAETDRDSGIFPLFPSGLGKLVEVDISGSIGGGQMYVNDSQDEQDGTAGAFLGLIVDPVGEITSDMVDVSYFAGPDQSFSFGAGLNIAVAFNSNLGRYYDTGDEAEFGVTFSGSPTGPFDVAGPVETEGVLTVTYDYN